MIRTERNCRTARSGELCVKGESAGLLYWNEYEKTRKTFRGDWVHTGDLFRRDKDGYYWFMGRGGDLLKVGGIFVAPLEIENCLLAHPAVKECAVIGAADPQGLVKPMAFIVTKEGGRAFGRSGSGHSGLREEHAGSLQISPVGEIHG